MGSLVLVAALALVFYAVIPGAGAFYVRSRWREFRRRMIRTSLSPVATYRDLRLSREGLVGQYRFFGGLEAIQGEDLIWLRSGELSVSVELRRVALYWLPSISFPEEGGRVEINEETLPDETPTQVPWKRVFSLPEGTQVSVSGPLYVEGRKAVFRTDKLEPLTVVIYDGQTESILRRAIWGGRHRNEYINPFTPGSITIGSFSLLILSYVLLRAPLDRLLAIIALAVSLFPVLPLLPPGLLLFFLYRRLWKEARFLRAERDMLLLPLRYFPSFSGDANEERASLPNGEPYAMERFRDRELAMKRLGTGKIRRASRLGIREADEHLFYVFGRPDGTTLRHPDDPMAELIMIPGNPLDLSRRCAKRARTFELLSSSTVVLGVLVNLYLVLIVLGELIK